MIQSSAPLASIIREVDSNYIPNSNDEILFILDQRGRVLSEKPSPVNMLFTNYTYVVVNTMNQLSYNGDLLTLNVTGGIIKINAEYTLKCYAHGSTLLASKWAELRKAGIKTILQQEVEQYNKSANLISDFYIKKKALEASISNKLNEYGLTTLSMAIELDGKGGEIGSRRVEVSMFKVSFKDYSNKAGIGLKAEIVTEPGQEIKALNTHFDIEKAEDELLKIIREYIYEHVSPEQLYAGYESSVLFAVSSRINEYLGAFGKKLADISIVISKSGKLDGVSINVPDFFNVRVRNSTNSLPLKYSCELVADPKHHARIYLFQISVPEIEEIIQDQVKQTFADDVTIEEFIDSLNTIAAGKVAEAINIRMAAWGRKVSTLTIETDPEKCPKIHYELEHDIAAKTKDGQEITISNVIHLQRNFSVTGKLFDASQIKDFEQWGKSELNRIIKNSIINKTYNELLYAFRDEDIKTEMQRSAEKIGYTVNQLITIPDFKGQKKPERFDLTYKDYNLNSKADGVSLAIEILIEGRINDFTKIMKLIPPGDSVTDSMQKKLDGLVRHFCHSIEPERFYMRFYYKDEAKGDKGSLEEEIKKTIQDAFKDDYDAEIRDITVNPLNTTLIVRYQQLQQGTFYVQYNDTTGNLTYRTAISIKSVHPDKWHVFNSKGYKPRFNDPEDTERNDIKNHLSAYLSYGLETVIIPKLKSKIIASQDNLRAEKRKLYTRACAEIVEIFGLKIELSDALKVDMDTELNPLKIEGTRELKKMAIAKKIDAFKMKMERHTTLTTEREKRIQEGYTLLSSEVRKIDEELATLEKDIYIGDNLPQTGIDYGGLLDFNEHDTTTSTLTGNDDFTINPHEEIK